MRHALQVRGVGYQGLSRRGLLRCSEALLAMGAAPGPSFMHMFAEQVGALASLEFRDTLKQARAAQQVSAFETSKYSRNSLATFFDWTSIINATECAAVVAFILLLLSQFVHQLTPQGCKHVLLSL